MPFRILPSAIRATSILECNSVGVMAGIDAEDGLIAWYSGSLFKWVLVDSQEFPFDCVISFNGDTLLPYGVAVHGSPAWVGATYCIYLPSGSSNWVAMPYLNLGYYAPATGAAFDWWQYNGVTPQTATFTKQGTAAADVVSDTDAWERWESDTQFGVYAAAGTTATGTHTVGLPMWKDGAGVEYVRSLETTGTPANYTYGAAYYDSVNSAWIIGNHGAAGGWHESAEEPSLSTPRTFTFTADPSESPAPTGADIVLTFDSFAKGDSTETAYIGEAAIWRT